MHPECSNYTKENTARQNERCSLAGKAVWLETRMSVRMNAPRSLNTTLGRYRVF